MKIALISERWEPVADEGMLVFLQRLAARLSAGNEVLVLHDRGMGAPDLRVEQVGMGRGLLSAALVSRIEKFGPDLIIYCPTACATLGALLRHRRLQKRFGLPCALLSLQSRSYPPWSRRWLLPQLGPWRLIVLSGRAANEYRRMGFAVIESRAGVDLSRFSPADREQRMILRADLSLSTDRRIALHVGHLAQYRNLEELEGLAREGDVDVVMVASTANAADRGLIAGLESAGVIVRHEFIPRIEDYYRAADLYVFPVEHGSGAIEFPLSVLEAMACDLPVVTTPFGALPEYFTEGEGLCFVGDGRSVLQATRLVLEQPVRNRERVRSFSWDGVLDSLETALREAMGR